MTRRSSISLLLTCLAIAATASARTSEDRVNRIWVEPVLATKLNDSKLRERVENAAIASVRADNPGARITSIDITGYTYEVRKPVVSNLEEDDLKVVSLTVVIDIKGDDDLFCDASLRKKSSQWEVKIDGCEI